MKKDLVQLIKDNPGAVFRVDNDCWSMYPPLPKPEDEMTETDYEDHFDKEIANDEDVIPRGEGYGSGNCYGGDILQALAEIVGVKIESV